MKKIKLFEQYTEIINTILKNTEKTNFSDIISQKLKNL